MQGCVLRIRNPRVTLRNPDASRRHSMGPMSVEITLQRQKKIFGGFAGVYRQKKVLKQLSIQETLQFQGNILDDKKTKIGSTDFTCYKNEKILNNQNGKETSFGLLQRNKVGAQ